MTEGDVYVFEAVVANPANGPSFVGYVVLNDEFLGIRFEGVSEDEVRMKATTFFEETREKREQTRANIEEGRRKAAETKAKKKILESQNP